MFTPSSFWSPSSHTSIPSTASQMSLNNMPKSGSCLTSCQSFPSGNPYNMALLAQYNPWSHLTSEAWTGGNTSPAFPVPPVTPSCFPVPQVVGLTTSDASRKRRTRTAFNQKQLALLEGSFERSQYPDLMTRRHISEATGLLEARIQVWFKNRRAKERKKRKAVLFAVSSCPKFTGNVPSYGRLSQGSAFCPHPKASGCADDSNPSSD